MVACTPPSWPLHDGLMAVMVGTGAAEGGAVGALVGSPAAQAYLVGNVMESARASDCQPVYTRTLVAPVRTEACSGRRAGREVAHGFARADERDVQSARLDAGPAGLPVGEGGNDVAVLRVRA
jgi:hypothetical protein